jgi:hypothetical protein
MTMAFGGVSYRHVLAVDEKTIVYPFTSCYSGLTGCSTTSRPSWMPSTTIRRLPRYRMDKMCVHNRVIIYRSFIITTISRFLILKKKL